MSGEFDRKADHDEDEMLSAQNEPSQEELEASVARLSASDEDHDTATRLRIVEHLLMSAPLVMPSVDFAERVIEAIRHQDFDSFNRYSAFGMIMGLGVAAAVVISMLSVFALLIANVLFNWTRVYQMVISLGGGVSETVENTYNWTGSLLHDSPVVGVLALSSIPLFFVWVWLMRVLKPSEMRA